MRCGSSGSGHDDDCCKSDCCTNITIWKDLRFTYGFGESLLLRNLKVHSAVVVETSLTTRNLLVDNDATVRGDVKVCGDTKLKGDLLVLGDETINGKLKVGKVEISEIDIVGDGNISGKIVVKGDGIFGGNVNVVGDATIKGKLTAGSILLNEVDTNGDANIGGNLTLAKNAAIAGNLGVAGDLITKTLDVKTTAKIEGALEVDGDANLTGSATIVTGALVVPKGIIFGSNTPSISGFLIDNSFTRNPSQTFIRFTDLTSQDIFGAPGSNSNTRIDAVSANFLDFRAKPNQGKQFSGGSTGLFKFTFDTAAIPVGKIPYMTGVVGSNFADTSNQDDLPPPNPIGYSPTAFFGVLKFQPAQDFLTSGVVNLNYQTVRNMNWLDRWTCGFHCSWVWVSPSA